ncbi:2832_t:CDS:10 [Rhizophagus irregularis]|nr:2832_t:CDS:10 [Rhizophagus irregularis]
MDEIETEIDEHIKKNEYVEDLESGNYTYGEKINYVAISPNGSIVAKFNPYDSSILVTKVTTNANKNIPFDKKKFFNKKPSNVFGWSLAISDIIDEGNDIGLVAISCATDIDTSPKEIEKENLQKASIRKQLLILLPDFQFILIFLFICYYSTDIKQSLISSEGMIKIFKFSFNDNNNDKEDDNYSIYHLGGAVTFLNNSNKNSTTLICMNCVEIQKINIILDKNIIISKEGIYLLPENLFKKLGSFKDSKCKWKYLLKSKFQKFLMIDTSKNDHVQSIELYDVNNLQLINVLFAYSYGDNIITIYLMESGLEVVSKKFDNIFKIKFLEFIEKDKKLFIIEEDRESNVKFHIWIISGCLNDYFSISKDDIGLSDSNISILSKYDEHHNAFTKANGKVVFKIDGEQFRTVHEITIQRTIFGENDAILTILKNFENSNLVYILISDSIEPEKKAKFQINDDMTTIISHACRSLAYLYKHTKSIYSREKYQKFINGIMYIIKDFIKNYPDNWKLMEVQHPLMAYLIYSRSFSLIKYILFETNTHAKMLHKPQSKYTYNNYLESANRDAVMLAYLLEYYSENSMTHICWMINVTKYFQNYQNFLIMTIMVYCSSYMDQLFYKPCFGEMRYNFLIRRFKELSVCQGILKVYVPLTSIVPKNSLSYKKVREDILPDIYMVPLPNFTTHNFRVVEKDGKGIFKGIKNFIYLLGYIFLPPVPAIEAAINSRWRDTMAYWMGPLYFYAIFLTYFSYLSQLLLNGDEEFNALIKIGIGIFYYTGIYLLIIEFRQIMKYRTKYITTFNIIDLSSIILGIIVFSLISFTVRTSNETIMILASMTTLVLWIELLLWFRLFSVMAINIFIFGNILRKIMPFFIFMLILIIGFGNSMFILFQEPSPLYYLKASNYTLYNGTVNLTLTGPSQDNPISTIWESILSMYYLSTGNLNNYDYWPLKLLTFIANVILVLVILNMLIALMNDTFNKAKEDGNLGLLIYRAELVNDFEKLDTFSFYNSSYICYLRDPELMKKWMKKSQELSKTKLYSWFNESINKENITYDDDGIDITSWYELISGNEDYQDSSPTPDHMTLWF